MGRRDALALRKRHEPAEGVEGARRLLAVGRLLPGRRPAGARRGLPLDDPAGHRRPGRGGVRLSRFPRPGEPVLPARGRQRQQSGRRVLHRPRRRHTGRRILGGRPAAGRHAGRRLRRAVLPALAYPAPPVRRGGLRAAAHLEEAGSRLGVHQIRGPQGHHDPAVQEQPDHPGPAFDAERRTLRRERPGTLAGLLRHPRPVSRHRPDPRAAAGRRGDRRPAQVHRHRAGLAARGESALRRMQSDLEQAMEREV